MVAVHKLFAPRWFKLPNHLRLKSNSGIRSLYITILLLFPAVSLAADPFGTTPDIKGTEPNNDVSATYLADFLGKILDFIWPLFMAFAIIMFIWAGVSFLLSHSDPQKSSVTSKTLLLGVIGLIVAMLAFTIPFIIRNIIGL